MHTKKIAHRDIKLENILMARNKDPLHVKLTDFGFSAMFDENKMFTESLFCHVVLLR